MQFDACRAWITSLRSLGFELIEERFDDEGYSGTTLDRPALQRLLNVVRSGGIEQVVIYRLDRLSRNLRHFTTLFEELGEHNVALEIVTAPGMGNAAMDKLMLNVLGSFAEFERDLAASRIAGRAPTSRHTGGELLARLRSDIQPIPTQSSWSFAKRRPALSSGFSSGPHRASRRR